MRERLPRRLQVALTASTLAGALALAGCAPAASAPTPAMASPSATVFFANDEEALAAATAAYEAYLKVSDEIAADGGVDPERITRVVTEEEAVRQYRGFESLRAGGLHISGTTTWDSPRLQAIKGNEVVFYLCTDISAVRVINSNGIDVTPSNRVDRQPIEATAEVDGDSLYISSDSSWSGDNFC